MKFGHHDYGFFPDHLMSVLQEHVNSVSHSHHNLGVA